MHRDVTIKSAEILMELSNNQDHLRLMNEILSKRKQDNMARMDRDGREYNVSKKEYPELYTLHTKNKYVSRLFGYDLIWR